MRTNDSSIMCLAAAALCGFFFALGAPRMVADPVQNCTMECLDTYAWWDVSWGDSSSRSAQVAGNSTNTTFGIPTLFCAASNTKTPLKMSGTCDLWDWTENIGTCQNADKTWPSPQQVSPSGDSEVATKGTPRFVCTPK